MIPARDLLADFHRMLSEHWRYVWGSASTGCVDCSGAFVWSFRRHGESIPHGSNAIARQHVRQLLPPSQARPGMAAFKAREPGQKYYALPDKYKSSGDLRDYYHIGLVDDDPAWVLNAQSAKTGFVRSRLRENWCAVGYLNKVKYEDKEVVPMSEMRVFCDHGSSVNLRRQPSVSAALVCTVPKGAAVEAGPCDVPEWMAVQWSGKSGYMMSAFLREADAATDASGDPADLVTLQLPQAAAMALRDALIRVMGVG